MEVAIRWSHGSTPSDPRFLIADVTGRTFKYCRVTETKGDRVQWQEISRNSKVPAFRAFDWSHAHNVVAVGQWSGETTVLGLESDAPTLALPVKSQRQCNAVAFNTQTLLATGLEKIRSDICLNVYDIQHWLADPKSRGPAYRHQGTEPVRKLAGAEGIVSIKFFPDQPDALVAGVKASGVRLYDLRDSSSTAALQYQTPCVHNLAIDPCDQNYFASASPTRDATVHVWDKRWTQRAVPGSAGLSSAASDSAVLKLKDMFHADRQTESVNIWSLKYSPAERGCLGILGSGGNFRIFRTKRDYVEAQTGTNGSNNGGAGDEAAQSIYVDWTESIGRKPPPRLRRDLPARGVKDGRQILAFEFTNVLSADQRPCAITLRGNQDVGIYRLRTAPPVLASSTLHEVMAAPAIKRKTPRNKIFGLDYWWRATVDGGRSVVPPKEGSKASQQRLEASIESLTFDDGWNETPTEPPSPTKTSDNSKERPYPKAQIGDVLSFADSTRKRCLDGYLFDAAKNIDILEDDPALQEMWGWIERAAVNAADGKMATPHLDFSYLGIFHFWNAQLGSHAELRKIEDQGYTSVLDSLQQLASQLELWDVDFPKTSKPAQRKLCLHALGFETNPDQMINQVKPLALAGRSVEGAFRALIGDDWQLAITALRSGPRHQQNRALGSVIALYGERESPDRIQRQADELLGDDSSIFTKAIVAYVTRTNPPPAIASKLPSHYRAALALKLAPDHELQSFITEQTQTAIRDGDVANILYTGLSGDSLALFQRYVEQTHDVQSAMLALAHVAPRFLRGDRLDQWRGVYRDQLNAWRLFLPRASFDVQSTRLSARSADAVPTLQPAVRQVTLRCTNCDHALHREPGGGAISGAMSSASASAVINSTPSKPAPTSGVLGGSKDGTRCPRCGAGLPRCVVCDHRTGVVEPLSRGGAEAERRRAGAPAYFDDFTELCLTCRHVYHRGHASAWFAKHAVCAAVDCECLCNGLDGKA